VIRPTECHPDGEANPSQGRQRDHQEDIEEYGGEWDPRYKWRAEVQFRRIARLAADHDTQTQHTDQTTDGYRDGPPVASQQCVPTVDDQYTHSSPDNH